MTIPQHRIRRSLVAGAMSAALGATLLVGSATSAQAIPPNATIYVRQFKTQAECLKVQTELRKAGYVIHKACSRVLGPLSPAPWSVTYRII